MVMRLDYANARFGAPLSPRLAWAHDVRGVGPSFNQGTRALSVGLGFNFQQNLQADIAYTAFLGGRDYAGVDPVAVPAGQPAAFSSSANPLKDRDFIAIIVSYSF